MLSERDGVSIVFLQYGVRILQFVVAAADVDYCGGCKSLRAMAERRR